jgi:hypothetical protein
MNIFCLCNLLAIYQQEMFFFILHFALFLKTNDFLVCNLQFALSSKFKVLFYSAIWEFKRVFFIILSLKTNVEFFTFFKLFTFFTFFYSLIFSFYFLLLTIFFFFFLIFNFYFLICNFYFLLFTFTF